MDIDEMPAGIELDILVAEMLGYIRVLAGTAKKNPPGAKIFVFTVADKIPSFADGVYIRHVSGGDFRRFAPSTDIATAWTVVEELHERGFYLRLDYANEGTEWYCEINNAIGGEPASVNFEIEASSAPLAICHAALKVMAEGQK